MKRPFFSILIPVYNVEKYINQCLESIINQTFDDFEVIMLDDGSTDGSAQICEKYVLADHRFRLFKKNNEGLLLTRRKLFSFMNGLYAICLDSDDFKPFNTLENNYKDIIKYKCDLLIYRYYFTNESGKIIKASPKIYLESKLFTEKNKEEIVKKFVLSGLINSLCIKVIKREIIDVETDYSEFSDVKGEDLLQSINLLSNANSIFYSTDFALYYRVSCSNRTNNFQIKYINDINLDYFELYKFCLKRYPDNGDFFSDLFHRYISHQRYNMLPLIYTENRQYIKNVLDEMKKSEIVKSYITFVNYGGKINLLDRVTFIAITSKKIYFIFFYKIYEVFRILKKIKKKDKYEINN